MNHWLMAPILIPAATAILLILGPPTPARYSRWLSVLSTLLLTVVSLSLLRIAGDGNHHVYALGDWAAPFGIVLALDRLSAVMVALTSVVALGSLLFAVVGWDSRGKNYHTFFQFQLMGLNGAFLTGDLFNLFVFFEVLLIASYALVLYGGGEARIRAGLHYAIVNILSSSLFLIALGVLYGTLGSLTMADMAVRVATVAPETLPLVTVGGLLLLVVFGVKAAVLPLHLWLPDTYEAASPPVAALFAIMTKVGIYAILRVFFLLFGAEAGDLADLVIPILLPAGLLTLAAGSLGVLAARTLNILIAYLVISSVGTLLISIGLSGEAGLRSALFYLVHSTIVVAALFLLAELIRRERGDTGDRLEPGPPVGRPTQVGILFFLASIAIIGLPPLSGFVGKFLILRSAIDHPASIWIFTFVLGGGLFGIIALGRAGSVLFWKTAVAPGAPMPRRPLTRGSALLPVAFFLLLTAGLTLGAGPVHRYLDLAAAQLIEPSAYIQSVLSAGSKGR